MNLPSPHPAARRNPESGTALVASVIAVAVVSTTLAGALLVTSGTSRNTQRSELRESAIAVGDAYIEWAFAQWRTTCQSQRNTTLAGNSFDGLSEPNADFLPDPEGFEISNYTIHAMDADGAPVADRTVRPASAKGQNLDDTSYFYLASVDVTVKSIGATDVTARVRRVLEKRLESPWKYAIAYLGADRPALEIHPSPIFTVNGWVHSNGTLYASPDGGNPLRFLERVTSVDDYFQGYMDGDWQWRGRSGPAGAAPSFATGMPHAQETRKDAFGIAPGQFNPTDSDPNNDSYRELLEIPAAGPDPLTDSTGANPRFYNSASVRVLINNSNTVTILNSAGNPVSATSPSLSDRNLYDAVRPAITTNQNIQDGREAATVRLTTFDVSKLKSAQVPGWNGVIYISDMSAAQDGVGAKRGIRLKNGSTLPTGGLTVVSDNPVYIQGNYNSGANRQPSAVIGDAVMVLSNNWNDANSTAGLGSRKATDTTVNTAILSGIVPTDASYPGRLAYSGGVENFPRFLEDWSGRTFNYTGSMVQLFYSKQAKGRWGKDNVYNPPNRNWAFDVNFRTNPPPGTLFTTSYIKQRWYLE